MGSARKQAEDRVRLLLERLERWDAPFRPRTVNVDADDLRALLAEQDGAVACTWCGAALTQDPEAPHRWRCAHAVQGKCFARGDWYLLGDDLADACSRPAPAPAGDEVREAAEAVSQTYYEIAAEAIGEDKVRAEFKRRFDQKLVALARPAKGGAE